MSTIAYKNGVLAADSMVSLKNKRYGKTKKIFKKNKLLVGFCVDFINIEVLYDYFEEVVINKNFDFEFIIKEKLKLFKHISMGNEDDFEFEAMIINENFYVYYCDTCLNIIRIDNSFHSIGSGNQFAIGAMHYGATAVEAVKIASRYDIHTNNDVECLQFD